MHRQILEIPTRGRGLVDITAQVQSIVARAKIDVGLCHVFVRHTSASLVVQENADPSVLRDLERFLSDLAPESRPWEHDAEGPDDMPAHAKSALTKTSETLPVDAGRVALGTWQALYLWEHRTAPHVRQIIVTVTG